MTRVPMGSTGALFAQAGLGTAKSPRQEARYPGIHFSQFTGAERIAAKYGFSRDDLDRFALESHPRAAAATTARKSVVEGTSVSVRVDLGGRRLLKKKQN